MAADCIRCLNNIVSTACIRKNNVANVNFTFSRTTSKERKVSSKLSSI